MGMDAKLPINQIICGDCLEVMADWPDGCVDLVLTDIPYNKVNRPSNGLRNLDKGAADSAKFDWGVISDMANVAVGSMYIFCGTEQVSLIRATCVGLGMSTRLGIWQKTNPPIMNGQHLWLSAIECCVYAKWPRGTFNRHCVSPVWHGPTERQQIHPTQKPLWLFKELIGASSNPTDLILDPFCGSGTTCVAAKKLGRKYIGIDISPEYCEIARKRLEAVDSGVPVKEAQRGQMAMKTLYE
jgi:DNA modification methylase